MAQERDSYNSDTSILSLIPKASTDIKSGDVVVMPRRSDPISMAALGATSGRIEPIAAAREGQWSVGVCDTIFTSAVVGATEYATPTQKLPVKHKGLFRLAITNTAGKVGDSVRYSSGASGAQLFVIDNQRHGWAVARIAKDFSGATANDVQLCELVEIPLGGPNLYHWLENCVLKGCLLKQHSAAGARSQNIIVGNTGGGTGVEEQNVFMIQNRAYSAGTDQTLDVGDCSVTTADVFRARWVVARSGGFASRTCSGVHSGLGSYTATGVSSLMLVPKTLTAGEIPIGLLLNFSKPQSYTTGIIIQANRSPSPIPKFNSSWGI